MVHLDFTWERREKLIRKEEFEEGRKCGLEQGIGRGRANSILEVLEELGPVPPELSERINAECNVEMLRKWLKLAAKSESIEEFELNIQA